MISRVSQWQHDAARYNYLQGLTIDCMHRTSIYLGTQKSWVQSHFLSSICTDLVLASWWVQAKTKQVSMASQNIYLRVTDRVRSPYPKSLDISHLALAYQFRAMSRLRIKVRPNSGQSDWAWWSKHFWSVLNKPSKLRGISIIFFHHFH